MIATSPSERCWLAWRTLGVHLSLANLNLMTHLYSTQPKTTAASLGPGTASMGSHEGHAAHRVILHRVVQSTSRWERAVLGRAAQFCCSLPSYCTLPWMVHSPPSFSAAYVPACSPASRKAFTSFSAIPQALNQAILILCVLGKHAYDMFTCVHMLVEARVQHLLSSSITITTFFIFKQQSLWAWSSPQVKTSGLASLRDPPVCTSSEWDMYTSCPALHLGLRFSLLSHLPLPLLINPSSVLCVCYSVTIPVTIYFPFHLRFICNYEYVSVSVGVMYACEYRYLQRLEGC